ncbi:hypothetical protein J1N35_013879 [Gossypium stocksii]|uniref:DUF4283 domain-containing protein n=1 Tax=Gossypium stocksii TaxID=47602 RepID=A0A9D3VUI6_9ROSI|nr:hypothetical protein J1N35_013879 [Gossypium stocksii]
MFGKCSTKGLILKKVRFCDKDESVNVELEVDQIEKPTTSWKDKLVGSSPNSGGIDLKANEDFELLEGDAQKSFINGIPSIEFSNRIQHVLIRSPWIIFDQYLIVQPWSVSFDLAQTFPRVERGDGFIDSELATPYSDNGSAIESLSRPSLVLQGLVDVSVVDPIRGLNLCRHTTISFKDLKNQNDDVSTEGGFTSISGVEKLKTPRRNWGEKVGEAHVSKKLNKLSIGNGASLR